MQKNKTGKNYCATAVLKYIVIITSEPMTTWKYFVSNADYVKIFCQRSIFSGLYN